MNCIKEIAELIGVSIDEEFQIRDADGTIVEGTYILNESGLFHRKDSRSKGFVYSNGILEGIIRGVYTVVPKPWEPKDGEKYFFISVDGSVYPSEFSSESEIHKMSLRMGNVFRTREEAETNIDGWLKNLDGQPDVSWRNL